MPKVYYIEHGSSPTQSDQIIPSPEISIGTSINYASENNNVIVGHNHTITLTGVAAAYRRTNPDDPLQAQKLEKLTDSIIKLRNIFSRMGGTLYVKSDEDADLIVAIGGKLISCNITESDNNWKNTANYTIELEFQSITSSAESESCLSSLLSGSTTPNAVDNSKYKIKEYSENFTVEIGDDIYNRIRTIDSGLDSEIENMFFNFTYNISATGKHFFVNNQLLPAWEQAKNFCQNKLFNKIKWLASNLKISGINACSATKTLQNMQQVPDFGDALLSDLNPEYQIFNEQVSSSISESDGKFSAVYKCIIKRVSNANNYHIHTFTKNIQHFKSDNLNTKITVNGTIQGLVLGGLVYNTNGLFSIPSSGNLIVTGNGSSNVKYDNALTALTIYVAEDDFQNAFKDQLDITYSGLYIDSSFSECSIPPDRPKPSSFNLTHNLFEGIITYTAEFSSDRNCQSEFSNVTVNVNKPTQIFATFVIPGAEGTSGIGTILQDLGTQTSKTIDFTIQGRSDLYKRCCYTNANITNLVSGLCSNISIPASIASQLPNPEEYILKTKSKTTNFMDGSYTINLGYICNAGCNI